MQNVSNISQNSVKLSKFLTLKLASAVYTFLRQEVTLRDNSGIHLNECRYEVKGWQLAKLEIESHKNQRLATAFQLQFGSILSH